MDAAGPEKGSHFGGWRYHRSFAYGDSISPSARFTRSSLSFFSQSKRRAAGPYGLHAIVSSPSAVFRSTKTRSATLCRTATVSSNGTSWYRLCWAPSCGTHPSSSIRIRRSVRYTQPAVFGRTSFPNSPGRLMTYSSCRNPITFSRPVIVGTLASLQNSPSFPRTRSLIAAKAEARDPLTFLKSPRVASEHILVQGDGRVDLPDQVRGHQLPDLVRIPRPPEDPHQLHEGDLREHVLARDHAGREEVSALVVHPEPHAAVQTLRRHHDRRPASREAPDWRHEVVAHVS